MGMHIDISLIFFNDPGDTFALGNIINFEIYICLHMPFLNQFMFGLVNTLSTLQICCQNRTRFLSVAEQRLTQWDSRLLIQWLLLLAETLLSHTSHDDVIKWKHFPHYWPFVRGIHRSPVNSPHKGQWHGAYMFSLICAWINGWVNNREAGDCSPSVSVPGLLLRRTRHAMHACNALHALHELHACHALRNRVDSHRKVLHDKK